MNSYLPANVRSFRALLLASIAAPLVWSQAPPVEPPSPDEPIEAGAQARGAEGEGLPLPPGVPPPPPGSGDAEAAWRIELRRAGEEAKRTMRDVERRLGGMRFGYVGPDARRLLVVASPDATDEAVTESRNELAIMSTILGRAARPERSRRGDVLLEWDGWRTGSGRDLDAMFLDGYGAVFLLGVDYALVKPETAAAQSSVKKSADTTWERTRRELIGQTDDDQDADDSEDPGVDRTFDEDRVNDLTQRLIEALVHASNIRSLKADEWIVVQVSGRAARGGAAAFSPDGRQIVYANRSPGGASVLQLKVKKSAVDDFAAKRLSLEEFKRAVEVSQRTERTEQPLMKW